MENVGFKVTIEYECRYMIDGDTFKKDFNSDPLETYKYISDNFRDDVLNFSGEQRIIKVEAFES